jgi:alkanesulfonate monooxygenase SsuD/methylene tetrahydromethanopterin reductase-like flavin-dependent oxidoreductase (luciferase family)
MIRGKPGLIVMAEVTDPVELANARAQDERFERNWAWLEAHAAEIHPRHRGKVYCIAGEELFVADTPKEALALARAAHPDDDGLFTGRIPKERTCRIYAHQRRMARLTT